MINLYMFRAGLLLMPTANQQKCMTYTNCYVYRAVPADDEQ